MLDIHHYIWTPTITATNVDEFSSTFEIKYLPRWFWYTLWNSLRRIILGYSFWWAVTALKIKWVPHEYTVIDWVKESAMSILLNFKKLRFKTDESLDKIQRVSMKVKWVGTYTSSDFVLPAGIECLKSQEYLFEITEPSAEVYIEMRIERWYGYMSIEQLRARESKNEDTDISLLLIDNDFNIVERLSFTVDEVIDDFIGNTKDVITISMTTISPLINPKDVLAFAAEVLCSYWRLFLSPDAYVDRSFFVDYTPEVWWPVSELTSTTRIQPIEILWLSERTRNALLKNNILFVEDLEKKKKNELISMRWVGKKAVDEIEDALVQIWKWLIH